MTDFEKYKEILDRFNQKYEVWQDGTTMVISVENDNACFHFSFDIHTGLAVSTELSSKVYSE
jgi:hypothetical protein